MFCVCKLREYNIKRQIVTTNRKLQIEKTTVLCMEKYGTINRLEFNNVTFVQHRQHRNVHCTLIPPHVVRSKRQSITDRIFLRHVSSHSFLLSKNSVLLNYLSFIYLIPYHNTWKEVFFRHKNVDTQINNNNNNFHQSKYIYSQRNNNNTSLLHLISTITHTLSNQNHTITTSNKLFNKY